MEEIAAQAAAHHPVPGHRRVDAAGHQHHRAPAHPHRQPALSRHSLGEHEHLVAVHLDEDLGVGAGQVDREPVRLLDLPADKHRELRRRQRESLVPATGPYREGARGLGGQLHGGGDGRLGGLGDPEGLCHSGDAGDVPHPLRDPLRGLDPARLAALLAVGDAEQDDAFPLPDADRHAGLPDGGADVAVQDALELLPVPSLEHDLAQLEQDARLALSLGLRGGELRHPPSLPAGKACRERPF
jgi:hypothetical protein